MSQLAATLTVIVRLQNREDFWLLIQPAAQTMVVSEQRLAAIFKRT